ncbi:hypothetical protein HFN97_20545 [Rhizobium laguerreae]|uniref:PIN-like domain-containing protein n=1 Tax=Rhizobium TaxID=379 RepID=UPI001C9139FA|nr:MULTISPECIES: PIN-like domain-containing protein [Rhizobium]MBY2941832.1 hypothetical protein [Rhizobium leguminosarum]MBY3360187.1 hypothetical protein [Rhizobium laguerreae]
MRLDPFIRDYSQFLADLTIAIHEDDTAFYLDTSVLTWAITIGRDARKEFLTWCRARSSGAVRVPVWAAHELHKHLLRGSLNANLQKAISETEKKLSEFSRVTTERADDQLCLARGYAGRDAYVTDVHRTVERLKALGKIAGDEAALAAAADEVVDFVNERLLDTSLDAIFTKLNSVGEMRYSHLVPPGYHDQKPENKFGDVVIWEEILADLEGRPGNPPFDTILISRDEKTDWVSSAPLVVNGEKPQKSNRDHELDVTLAHPLLIHEFSKRTTSRTLYVVPPSFVASTIHYAERKNGVASTVSRWFSAAHRPSAIEKLATAVLATNVDVAPLSDAAHDAFAAPTLASINSVDVFPLIGEFEQAAATEKDAVVAQWAERLLKGDLQPLAFGKLLAWVIISDPAWLTEAPTLLEAMSHQVSNAKWNTIIMPVLSAAFFDPSGDLLVAPQSKPAMVALQLEEDERAKPAFVALAALLSAADARLPYLPGLGQKKVEYVVAFVAGSAGKPNLIREIRLGGQLAVIEDVNDDGPQALNTLLGRAPDIGCTGKELRSIVARHLLVPANLLATTWDKQNFTWPAELGLASIDTTSDGGLSQLED